MLRYSYLLMIFIILFFSASAKKNNPEISQKWIQIQTNEDGSKSYYNKQLISENGNYKEVELDYHTFVSSLNLLDDSSYENSYLNFEYTQGDHSLPAGWNGKWWTKKTKDPTFLCLQTTLNFMYGFDPVPGSNVKPPGPKEIVFKFYVAELTPEKLKLALVNQGYFPKRKLEFISEKKFFNRLKWNSRDCDR